jgi:hypothetical protein
MAHHAAGVAGTFLEKDGLHFGLEDFVIERLRRSGKPGHAGKNQYRHAVKRGLRMSARFMGNAPVYRRT